MKKRVTGLIVALAMLLCFPVNAAETEKAELPVIMYHHLSRDSSKCGDYVLYTETFRGDMEYLRECGYKTVSLDTLCRWKKGECELPEKSVLVTFDDGQLSFAEYALPVLEEFGFCAVVAIVGKYADEYTENGDTDARYAYMSWEKLAELVGSGAVEAASHTFDMHSLSGRSGCLKRRGESLQEYIRILGADDDALRERFRSRLQTEPLAFAYPFGSFCTDAAEFLASRGYEIQFTCEEKVNVISRSKEPLILGRFNRAQRAGRKDFFARLGIEP